MQVFDVIKNESSTQSLGDGPNDVLISKFSGEDFNTNSQLIVTEAEEAIFVKDGVAVAVLGAGRHTLKTSNYPFIGRLVNSVSGGVSAFNCRVYFVNTNHQLEMLWGTDTPIQLRDPVLKLQTSVQARGSYSISVKESKKLLIKLLGTNSSVMTRSDLNEFFRSAFLQYIKDAIGTALMDSGQEILAMCSSREPIANSVRDKLATTLDEYGVALVNFYIAAMDIPQDDPNRLQLENAFAQKGIFGILGDDWQRQQSVDILKELAANEGAGGIAALGAGAGMGLAMGGSFGQIAAQIGEGFRPTEGAPSSPSAPCGTCQQAVPQGARFCPSCGSMQTQQEFCANCGVPKPSQANFCAACGNDFRVVP